ncbi:hypothetical protein PUN28_007250 [Cardiocondyla obscurior]|uniref:Uncharacterized protein n=1 Tax=Cardiocondyla obscurior TaxID=286306 RepID=A0AAW2G870_9HYME
MSSTSTTCISRSPNKFNNSLVKKKKKNEQITTTKNIHRVCTDINCLSNSRPFDYEIEQVLPMSDQYTNDITLLDTLSQQCKLYCATKGSAKSKGL